MIRVVRDPSTVAMASPQMLPKVDRRYSNSSPLSLRMSCDRCRVQKLKCSVPAGAEACQRCMRARVSCVFGRRTPSKRSSRTATRPPSPPSPPTQNEQPPLSPQRAVAVPPAPSSGLITASASASASSSSTCSSLSPTIAPSGCQAATPDTELDTCTLIVSEPMLSAAPEPELEPRSCDALHLHASWDGSAVDLDLYEYSFASTMPKRNGDMDMDMVGYDWLEQSGFALDDGSTFEMGRFDLAPWSHLPPPTAEARRPLDDMAAINGTSASNTSRISNAATATTGQRLTALVSEIQQQLRRLEEGPWHTDSTHSLHDYPVGTILELSQQFSAIAGSILSSTVCTSGGMEEEAGSDEDNDNSGRTAGCATADTPTMLLIMCGYIWLVRIYGIVMGHFQKHLDRMPTGDPRHLRTTTGVISPIAGGVSVSTKLRLGELPCTDVALSLQQIHTAVRMLLDVLHEIEGHLGRGAVAACDMAVALLLNSGRPQNGSSRGLGIKAAAVKKLLREKMGL
ncbi:hypothetical protein HDV62DRAFT_392222 [Trichoderma sp. SZMC 28011]